MNMNKIFLKALVTKTAANKYQAVATSDAVDRYGDIVEQSGISLDNYMKNPVMLWAHDSSQLPVAKCTGIDRSTPGRTVVDFEFADASQSPLAPYVKNSYDGGFLNALSIGFMELNRKGAVITGSELLEISFVPVPANQEALRKAVTEKSLDLGGISADIEKAIDAIKVKGEVADQVGEVEAYEMKWKKWDQISEILSAFWTVYFDVATDVEQFGDLLTESIELLREVAANDGADDDDAYKAAVTSHKERITKMLGGRTVKAGKTISKKNAKIITEAMGHMQECIKCMGEHMDGLGTHRTALEDMLNTSASSDEGSGKGVDSPAESKHLSLEEARIVRNQVRSLDHQANSTLGTLNRFIADREKK